MPCWIFKNKNLYFSIFLQKSSYFHVPINLLTIQSKMSKQHPGFHRAAEKIAHMEGIPIKKASAILASKTRNASAAAKRKNPRLKRVK